MEKIHRYLLDLLYPILYRVGKIHSPYTRKEIKEDDVFHILKHIELGDIILSRTYGELTNLVIPGYWSHVAMFAPDHQGSRKKIVESVNPCVQEKGLFEFFLKKDEVVIIRPKLDANIRAQAACEARSYLGRAYDYWFSMPNGFNEANLYFYCAELIYWSYKQAYPNWQFALREILGVPTVKPDDFMDAKRHFEVIWVKYSGGIK